MDDVWAWANNWSLCQRPLSNLFSWLASLQPPLIFSPTAALLLAPNWSLLPFLLFFSVWFIFVVPSFLPFQKVMHTRKRHSELYHELNHSSKFHTIDRYSRDPAMSTFKVRPLPKKRGIGGTRCNLVHPTPLPPPFHPLCRRLHRNVSAPTWMFYFF